jgi:hypothetical protein
MKAAQSKKPTTKATKKPTPKQSLILKTKAEHPKLTTREIAAIADTGHSHVIATFQRYGIDARRINSFKEHRADIIAGIQERLLSSVTEADIQKSPMGSRVLAACQLYDKERLERGQTTQNIGALIGMIHQLQDDRDAAA